MTKKSIKGTRTEQYLVAAYMAESAAYTRYTYYAKQAEKDKIFPCQANDSLRRQTMSCATERHSSSSSKADL